MPFPSFTSFTRRAAPALLSLSLLFGAAGCAAAAAGPSVQPSSSSASSPVSSASSSSASPSSSSSAVFSSSAVSAASSQAAAPIKQETVTVTVDETSGGGRVLTAAVAFSSGDTVYNALVKAKNAKGFLLKGSSSYISMIDGLAEFAKGSESGWVYAVNGSKPDVSCGNYKLKAGDSVKWTYVTKLEGS